MLHFGIRNNRKDGILEISQITPRQISEFRPRLVYIAGSRTAGVTQSDPVREKEKSIKALRKIDWARELLGPLYI